EVEMQAGIVNIFVNFDDAGNPIPEEGVTVCVTPEGAGIPDGVSPDPVCDVTDAAGEVSFPLLDSTSFALFSYVVSVESPYFIEVVNNSQSAFLQGPTNGFGYDASTDLHQDGLMDDAGGAGSIDLEI